MSGKEFLKPNWKKISSAVILSVFLGAVAFLLGRQYQDPWSDWSSGILKPVGGLFFFKLNPLLWLPAPLVSEKHNYIEAFPVDSNRILSATIPYWLIISYFFACTTIWIYKKVREK